MKLFIWDFHGTLERGNEYAALEMTNIILEKHGYAERLSESQCLELYGKKWFEYFERLLPHESKEKHLELQEDCFSFSIAHPEMIAKYIKLVDGAKDVLSAICEKHDQIVVSNTKPESLNAFLASIGIASFFPEGKAFATDFHAKRGTKKDAVSEYLKGMEYEDIVVIGDSVGDIELGLAFGAKTFLYAHPGLPFKDCVSDFKINDLRDVLGEV